MENLDKYYDMVVDMAVMYLPKLLTALVVLVLGFWLIKKVRGISRRALEKSDFNKGVSSFIVSLIDVVLKVFLLILVAGMVGFETASLIGMLAAAGFAVGLALQGSLSNFAAGILIIIFKPYKLGDWIEVDEKFGKVEEILIFNTIIVTPGLKTLIIPNSHVVNGIVTNYSNKGNIRVEIEVTMPYEESFPKIREILLEAVIGTEKVLTQPVPEIGISKFGSHHILIAVRPYTTPDHYWEVVFDIHKNIKAAFHDQNIKVAYPEGIYLGNIGE